jgi:hypothetical protein
MHVCNWYGVSRLLKSVSKDAEHAGDCFVVNERIEAIKVAKRPKQPMPDGFQDDPVMLPPVFSNCHSDRYILLVMSAL